MRYESSLECPECGQEIEEGVAGVTCDECDKTIKEGTDYIFIEAGSYIALRSADDPIGDPFDNFGDEDFCSMKCLSKRIKLMLESSPKPKKKKSKGGE